MLNLKQLRRVGVAAVLVSLPLLQASGQTTSPTPPQSPAPTAPPPAAKPMPPTQGQSATTPGKVDPLLGLNVLSSDGSKLGSVHRVKSTPDGKVEEIQFKTGGFLGFGGKIVAVPESKYTRKGDTIQLQMTADEVSKLPEVKDQS